MAKCDQAQNDNRADGETINSSDSEENNSEGGSSEKSVGVVITSGKKVKKGKEGGGAKGKVAKAKGRAKEAVVGEVMAMMTVRGQKKVRLRWIPASMW